AAVLAGSDGRRARPVGAAFESHDAAVARREADRRQRAAGRVPRRPRDANAGALPAAHHDADPEAGKGLLNAVMPGRRASHGLAAGPITSSIPTLAQVELTFGKQFALMEDGIHVAAAVIAMPNVNRGSAGRIGGRILPLASKYRDR